MLQVFKTQFLKKFNFNLILVILISQLKLLFIALIYLVMQVIVGAIQFTLETCFIKQPQKMPMLVLDLHLLLVTYQEFFELYFQLDRQILFVAFGQQAVLSIHSEIQILIVIITSVILISIHQTFLRLKLKPSFLAFQESFEM